MLRYLTALIVGFGLAVAGWFVLSDLSEPQRFFGSPLQWNFSWTPQHATSVATYHGATIIGGTPDGVRAPVTDPIGTPSLLVCPASNCPDTNGQGGGAGNPIVTTSIIQGRTSRDSEWSEWLAVDSLFVGTGNPNGQKVARYIGAVQAQNGGAAWTLNTDIVRNGTTFAGAPAAAPGAVGNNSTIGYELDLTNWDQDATTGGPFVVGMYINTLSSYSSLAGIYYGAAPDQPAPSWHNGIFFSDNTIKDNTIYDTSSSAYSYQAAGLHSGAAFYDTSTSPNGMIFNGMHSTNDIWLADNATVGLGISGTGRNASINDSSSGTTSLRIAGTHRNILDATGDSASAIITLKAGQGVCFNGTNSCITNATANVPIKGTATSDFALSGNVGEYLSTNVPVGSAVPLAVSDTSYDVASLSLTAGDWDCRGNVITRSVGGTTTFTAIEDWINTTSNTLPTLPNGGAYAKYSGVALTGSANTDLASYSIGPMRISLASVGTAYLSTRATFVRSTASAYGFIACRRVR